MKIKSLIEANISWIIYSMFAVLIFVFSYLAYLEEKNRIYDRIDQEILSVAQTIPLLLPKNYHDRTTDRSAVSPEEFKSIMLRLNHLTKNFHVDYVYSAVRKNNTMYTTACSATDEEMKTRINLVRYFDPYVEATPSMMAIFESGEVLFENNTDRWGEFRNVLVPMKSENGTVYITGVSLSLASINAYLTQELFDYFLFGIGCIAISLPIFMWRHRRISKLAYYDALTRLPNRVAFRGLANASLNLSRRNETPFALMYLDLDGFKTVNDTLGHSIGDRLLVKVAGRLEDVLRKSDIASRQGGDEFVIGLPDTDRDGAAIVAQKILDTVARPYTVDKHQMNVTFSIGIALFPGNGTDLETLAKEADIAMYESKRRGGNCYVVFGEE